MVRFFVRNAATVSLLVFATLLFGWISYRDLPRESFPDVEIPFVLVTTAYIGVSPEDIEQLVTIPMESELSGVADLKNLTSTSAEGVSIVALEFEPEVDIEDALQKVRDRVNRAKVELPEEAEEPAVREISFDDFPILIVNLAGSADEEVIKATAEELQDELQRIPGVLDVTLSGGLERQIRVQVDPVRLASYGLGLNDVNTAIGNENVNIPGGEVQADGVSFLLRVPGDVKSARDIEGIAIKRTGDRPVFIRDVARVIDGYEDRQTYARMNGQPSISLGITKRAGSNLLAIAEQAKEITAARAGSWPEGVSYRVLADQSKNIEAQVAELENNILTALILVVGVLVFSLGFRTSMFIAIAIPLSMLASFAVLELLGFTLNMVVLFSLILALGMLVDNGIVIVENIYRHMEEGKDIVQASIDGTQEVLAAVTGSTLTTVVAFLPLVFWTGIMGQFMGFLPKTVIIVLTASLIVAVLVMPVATSRFLPGKPPQGGSVEHPGEALVVPETKGIMALYRAVLEWSIRHRYQSLAAGGFSFIVTLVAFGFLNHGTEFFPETEPARATIGVRLPDGSDLEATDRVVRRIEGMLAQEPNVDVYVAESGVSSGGSALSGSQAASNEARLTVDFLPHENDAQPGEDIRIEDTFATIDRIRRAVAGIPGAEVTVDQERMGPPVGAPISVEVAGEDFLEVGAAAAEARRQLALIPGVTDLKDDFRVGRPEMRLRIDRGAAKRVGASTVAVANDVRTAVAGNVASSLRDGTDEYDILVELDPRYREDLQSVLALRIAGREDTSPSTFAVPLSSVASYELAGGAGAIRHVDQKLVVTITGDVEPGFNQNEVQGAVVDKLQAIQAAGELPPGVNLRLGGSTDEQKESQAFLGRAFLISLTLIALVLVGQFNRFSTMFIIMGSVVLSLIGVLWGHIITGTPFGIIMSGIGVISLAGVVVNNAIVLLDYVDQMRARGMDTHDALIRAGIVRFRPVMLTAVTTVLGLVPMAIGLTIDFFGMRVLLGGPNAGFWGPMAVAVIFGLTVATILTLVMVPTMYSIREDLGARSARLWARLRGGKVVQGAALLLGLVLLGAPTSAQAAPVSLDQAIAAAREKNLDLAILSEQTLQAESLRGQAWAQLSPKVSTQAAYTINEYEIAFDMTESIPSDLLELLGDADLGEPVVIQEKTAWSGNLSVVQPLFTASALPTLKGAYLTVDAARLDEGARGQQVRAGVVQAFYGLAIARAGLTLADTAVQAGEKHQVLAERQVQAGLAPERALVQARLRLSQAERERAGAEAQVVAAEEAFTQATGLPRDSEPVLPEEGLSGPADVDAALESALRLRPDLQAADTRSRVARLSHQARTLGFLPELDGRFTWAYNDNTGFSDEHWMWMLVFQANWTLWDGGFRASQLKSDMSQVRVAELVASQERQRAEEEVRTAWQQLQRARAAVLAVQTEVELARENLALAETAFQAGTATWLEVDDAQLGLQQAELSVLRERMNRDLAQVQLQVATGTW